MIMEMFSKVFQNQADMEQSFDQKLQDTEHRLLVVMENMRGDLNDMYNDKLSQHEDRITRIEKHLQMAA